MVANRPATALWLEDTVGRGWTRRELGTWADRARLEVAPAIGAAAAKPVFDALAAKGAFESADHGVHCFWRQILVAAFTIGS